MSPTAPAESVVLGSIVASSDALYRAIASFALWRAFARSVVDISFSFVVCSRRKRNEVSTSNRGAAPEGFGFG